MIDTKIAIERWGNCVYSGDVKNKNPRYYSVKNDELYFPKRQTKVSYNLRFFRGRLFARKSCLHWQLALSREFP